MLFFTKDSENSDLTNKNHKLISTILKNLKPHQNKKETIQRRFKFSIFLIFLMVNFLFNHGRSVVIIKSDSFSPLTIKEKESLQKAKDFFREDDSIKFSIENQRYLTWDYTSITAFKDFLEKQEKGQLEQSEGEIGSIIYQSPVFKANYLNDRADLKLFSFQPGSRFYRFSFNDISEDKLFVRLRTTVEQNDCGHLLMFWEGDDYDADAPNSTEDSENQDGNETVKVVTAYMVPHEGEYSQYLDSRYVIGGKYSWVPMKPEHKSFYIMCPYFTKPNPLIELRMELILADAPKSSDESVEPSVPMTPPPLEALEEALNSSSNIQAVEEQVSSIIQDYVDKSETESKNSMVTIDEKKTEFNESDPETEVKKQDDLFQEQKTVIKSVLSKFF